MSISVIIPSRTDEYCERLLQSVQKCGDAEQIIVVDSGLSSDFRWKWAPYVTFIDAVLPFNFSQAINTGVEFTLPRNDLLLINDDCEMLTPSFIEWLEHLLEHESTKDYGIISLKIKEGGVGNPEQQTVLAGTPIQEATKNICFVAPLIRRAAWKQCGPMDEAYVGSFGDDDYCWTAKKHGWKCGVTGLVSVRHGFPERSLGNSFLRYMPSAEHQQHSRNARDYFLKKWGKLPDPAHYKI